MALAPAAYLLVIIMIFSVHSSSEHKTGRQFILFDTPSPPDLSSPYNLYFDRPVRDGQPVGHSSADLFRQLGILNGLFNNRFTNGHTNLFSSFRPVNQPASPIVPNPNPLNAALSSASACEGSNGDSGICVLAATCSLVNGKPRGSCGLGRVCCVNTISTCSGTTTVNNTYFQTPQTLNTPSTCSLTVKLDKRLPEQKFPICQLRLDFVSFSIAQPEPGGSTKALQDQATRCLTDNFQVGGALNNVPTICGENANQHMYVHVPPSDQKPSDVKLIFNLGSSSINRSWKIKVAILPCGANYLAPFDCLQFFTSTSGTVTSFNWADVAIDGARQLAYQDYRICFRTEVLDNKQLAKKVCVSECSVANGGDAFLLSTLGGATDTALVFPQDCLFDYLRISNGINADDATKSADRFCGNFISAGGVETQSKTVCSDIQPFGLHYFTDESEGYDTQNDVPTEAKNTGFCLKFQQQ